MLRFLVTPLLALAVTAPVDTQLDIRSQPGVDVVWEGVPLGTTDRSGIMTIFKVPPGRYSIELQKEGFETRRDRVTVVEGGSSYESFLTPLPKSAPVSPPIVDALPLEEPVAQADDLPPLDRVIQESAAEAEPVVELDRNSEQVLETTEEVPGPGSETTSEPTESDAELVVEDVQPSPGITKVADTADADAVPAHEAGQFPIVPTTLAVLLAGLVAIAWAARRPGNAHQIAKVSSEVLDFEAKPSGSEVAPEGSFLKELEEREQALDGRGSDEHGFEAQPEVLEVIDVEVIEIEDEDYDDAATD